MNEKILLMYISHISGHHSATLAIEQAIRKINPKTEVLNINGFSYVYPIAERLINALYMWVIKRMPVIWDFLYDNPSVAEKINGFKKSVNSKNRGKIKKLIEANNCKVVICSQAFPCGMVADYKKHCQAGLKLIAVVTDFIPHAYWVYDEIDFYVVGSDEAREALIKKGVAEEKVKLFGIPIDPKFLEYLDKKLVSQDLSLPLDKPIVLIMGGSRGIGPIKSLINSLDNSEIDANFLVVTGANLRLFNSLKKVRFEKNIYIYGHVNYIDKLMSIADILITKPGGITVSEALAKQLPMLIIKPIPGQEQYNTDYLLKYGLAEKAEDVYGAVDKLKFILNHREELSLIKQKISEISKPRSSLKIAELVLGLC